MKGKYALFQTKGDNWMIHRMDPPLDPEREPMPKQLKPMLATLSTRLPRDEDAWAYEIKWDGVRAIAYSEGGHLRLESRNLREITSHYPELRALGPELGSTRGGPRRRGGRLRRRRPAQLRAAPEPHEPRLARRPFAAAWPTAPSPT